MLRLVSINETAVLQGGGVGRYFADSDSDVRHGRLPVMSRAAPAGHALTAPRAD